MAELKLDEGEQKRLSEWNKEHLEKFHEGKEPYSGAIGGRLTFRVTHTGIGVVLKVVCGFCPDEVGDLTDYDLW